MYGAAGYLVEVLPFHGGRGSAALRNSVVTLTSERYFASHRSTNSYQTRAAYGHWAPAAGYRTMQVTHSVHLDAGAVQLGQGAP